MRARAAPSIRGGMSSAMPLVVGARVRVRFTRRMSVVNSAHERGVVTRVDARGVIVKLDSGSELLVEHAMITEID